MSYRIKGLNYRRPHVFTNYRIKRTTIRKRSYSPSHFQHSYTTLDTIFTVVCIREVVITTTYRPKYCPEYHMTPVPRPFSATIRGWRALVQVSLIEARWIWMRTWLRQYKNTGPQAIRSWWHAPLGGDTVLAWSACLRRKERWSRL